MSKKEKYIEYYTNGIIREKGTKKDGKPQKCTQWYQNGKKEWERTGYEQNTPNRYYTRKSVD